jgi:ankyrin repeat protein
MKPIRSPIHASTVLFLLLTLSVFLLASCGAPKEPVKVAPPHSVPQVAFISYLSGDVQYRDGSDWKDALVGQFLGVGSGIRTGDASIAEIQVADKASVLLHPQSTMSVQNLESSPYSLNLEKGTIIAKVSKLPGVERFRILSGNSVVTVHGTRFLVSQDSGTRVAVSEGTVSVLPTGLDPSDIMALTTDTHLQNALKNLDSTAVKLQAGQEVMLKPEIGRTERSVLSDIADRLTRIQTAEKKDSKNVLSSARRDLLSNLLTYVGQRVVQEMPQPQAVSSDSRTALNSAGAMKLLPVPSDQKELSSVGLATVTVKTAPEDAEIYLGERDIGKHIFSGLFAQGETVTFTVRKAGYEPKSVKVTFSHDQNQTINVSLDKMKPAYGPQTFLEAVSRGNMGVIDRYLETGGNPNVRDSSGLPAIALALGAQRTSPVKLELSAVPKVLERLLSGGADPNAPFSFGGQELTPLYLVLATGLSSNRVQYDLLNMFLKAGADPNVYVQNGNIQVNALSMAIVVGIERKSVNFDLLKTLLKFGANVNAVMVYQGRIMTPLVATVVIGAELGYVTLPLVELLIQNGADINGRVNIDGQIGTPLYFAEKYGFANISALLKKYGAIR